MKLLPSEKIIHSPNCKQCSNTFDITDKDLEFYTKMDVPPPTHCPSCRQMRRMAWCNEWVLYKNRCSACSRPVISYLPEDDERDVLCFECFYGDRFDPLAYGREIDWGRSILDQIHELEKWIPHLYAAVDSDIENSEYMHCAGQSKNYYMTFHADYNEDCYYGYGIKRSKDCMDNHYCHESQFCYECVDVSKCNNMYWSQDCENCSNCWFVRDCVGCQDCFLCTGLRNKTHFFLNEKLTPEEYKKKVWEFKTGSYRMIQSALVKLRELEQQHTYKHLDNTMCENVTGNKLRNCNNAYDCFDCTEIRDSKYCSQIQYGVDNCYDIYQYGIHHSFCYETSMTGIHANNLRFCFTCNNNVSDMEYCLYSINSSNCFGCVCLKKQTYCIFNKQYSKEEYIQLKEKLIQKMKADGEWWEFFPIAYSESCYDETMAQNWYPKTKEEVLKLGWRWRDDLPGTTGKESISTLPDSIDEVDTGIMNEILCCGDCSKNYRIVSQELAFYIQNKLPLPRECFDCRRKRRFGMRTKRRVHVAPCHDCWKDIETYHEEGKKIACEECYRSQTY